MARPILPHTERQPDSPPGAPRACDRAGRSNSTVVLERTGRPTILLPPGARATIHRVRTPALWPLPVRAAPQMVFHPAQLPIDPPPRADPVPTRPSHHSARGRWTMHMALTIA